MEIKYDGYTTGYCVIEEGGDILQHGVRVTMVAMQAPRTARVRHAPTPTAAGCSRRSYMVQWLVSMVGDTRVTNQCVGRYLSMVGPPKGLTGH